MTKKIDPAIFDVLRAQVLAARAHLADEFSIWPDLIPISYTTAESWFCLGRDGAVVELRGSELVDVRAAGEFSIQTTMLGWLSVDFPLATAFLAMASNILLCPTCCGAGRPPEIDPAHEHARNIVCCGGLGWVEPFEKPPPARQ
jgi:hypothetical protein